MRAVKLGAVEAGLLRAYRRRDEIVAQAFDFGLRQGARARLRIVRRTHGRADQILRRAVAGMMKLRRCDRAARLDAGGEPGQALEQFVAIDAKLAGKALPHALHMRGAGHGEREAALGAHGEPMILAVG